MKSSGSCKTGAKGIFNEYLEILKGLRIWVVDELRDKLLFCSVILFTLIYSAGAAHAEPMKSVDGTVVEAGDFVTIKTLSDSMGLIKFNADIPRYEMTTGLTFAGEITKGQAVRLVYGGEPEGGLTHGMYLLFNPDSPTAADIATLLNPAENGAFLSDNEQYHLAADADTKVMDSLGRPAELRAGQYILGWFREAVFKESAVLGRAVILNLYDDAQAYRQIKIMDSGDVLLDDGPIVRLNEFQTAFCRQYHMAPIRPIAEALGYTVEWEPDSIIHIINDGYLFNLNIKDEYYQLNDKFVYFSGQPFIIVNDQVFADYSVINALVNKSGSLNAC